MMLLLVWLRAAPTVALPIVAVATPSAAPVAAPPAGNVNTLVLELSGYAAALTKTGGSMPEFVNPKYADATRLKFKKPTRLECMMQVRFRSHNPNGVHDAGEIQITHPNGVHGSGEMQITKPKRA